MHMKSFLAVVLLALGVARVSAQVNIELSLEQEQFLPSETIPLTVKITNRSGQPVHFGTEADWLTFSVEAADNFVVLKNAEVPVAGEFDLESSQMAIKHVDLQPYFVMNQPGRYRVTATLHLRQWGVQIASAPGHFDVITGAKLWEQDFGVPAPTNGLPEVRKYTLEKANYLKSQLRLYVQVSDAAEAQVFRVSALGPVVAFSRPEAQVDRRSRLNVLWQAGAQSFSYVVVNPDGSLLPMEYYDNFFSRPRLVVNENGEVMVQGGTRRAKPTELPSVKAPNELPHTIELPSGATAGATSGGSISSGSSAPQNSQPVTRK